jgi:hypothetical protein
MTTTFHEKYYSSNHSLRDLFLQAVHRPGDLLDPCPDTIAASRPGVRIDDLRWEFAAVQLLFLGGLLFVALRHAPRFAFALGPLAVFVLLVSNRYYWQMWMISAMVLGPTYRKDWRHTAFLVAVLVWLGSLQLVEMTRFAKRLGGYLGSYGLFWIAVALVLFELVSWRRRRRGGTEPTSGE